MDLQPPTFPNEGTPPTTPPPSVFQSGQMLLLMRQGLPLPADRCFKCNAPATVTKRKNLSWHHPAIYLGILAGLLVYVILPLCLQKKASVEFGLCEGCASKRSLWLSTWLIIMFSIVPFMYLAIEKENGYFALAGSIAFGALISARIGYPKRIDDAQIVLAGSGEAYRNNFPKI